LGKAGQQIILQSITTSRSKWTYILSFTYFLH